MGDDAIVNELVRERRQIGGGRDDGKGHRGVPNVPSRIRCARSDRVAAGSEGVGLGIDVLAVRRHHAREIVASGAVDRNRLANGVVPGAAGVGDAWGRRVVGDGRRDGSRIPGNIRARAADRGGGTIRAAVADIRAAVDAGCSVVAGEGERDSVVVPAVALWGAIRSGNDIGRCGEVDIDGRAIDRRVVPARSVAVPLTLWLLPSVLIV